MFLDSEQAINELDKGLGSGPLTLEIVCTQCNAHFELNKEGVAMALLTNASFIEYLRFVQSSPCSKCTGLKAEL
jgi:hypothetical protein